MKRILTVIYALLATVLLSAQSQMTVQAPNVVALDEQFKVVFVVEGEKKPSEFNWNPGNDFQLVWGPTQGSSYSFSVVNGKRTQSSQNTYSYILLARKAGTFTLPAATAVVKGATVSSPATSIEVVRNGGGGSSSASSQQQGSQSQSSGEISRDDLFLRLTLSKKNVVVGEPVTATLKLYSRVNIAGFEDARFPTFSGFWNQEMQTPTNIEFKRESLGDNIYSTALLRSWVLIPQQAGDISIDPAELVCIVNVRAPSHGPRSIFDGFFEDDVRSMRRRVTSDACTVKVGKLPAGAPASFGGGVGSYSLKAYVSKDSLRTHDAASLVVTVSGKGNVSMLEAPKISFPSDFEVYDTKVSDKADKGNGYTSGTKTFEYPFIPRSHGEFTLGPVEYSYYDVSSGKYVTLTSDPIAVNVAKGNEAEASNAGQLVSGVVRKDVRNLGEDIRFIVTKKPSLVEKGRFFVFSGLFWLLLILMVAAAAAFWFAFRKIAARRSDVVGSRNRQATKMARKRLSKAGEYLQGNLYTAFYEELHKALLGFISDKLNIDSADMSRDNIAATLAASGVDDALASEFNALLDACEFARYSPSEGHEAMNSHYESAVNVISMIDSSMKKNTSSSRSAVMMLALLLMVAPAGLSAAENPQVDSLWVKGTEAYVNGDWKGAGEAWESIARMGLESPVLYYNLGNAYFKDDDLAHAILSYERALKLDPSYADARFNLEYASSLTQDKIESVPEFFFKSALRKLCWTSSSDTWAVVFLVLVLLALASCLAFLLSARKPVRVAGFFSMIVLVVLAGFSLGFSLWQRSDRISADSAIIVKPVASVKSTPGAEASKDLFVLHEGAKVSIEDEVGEWLNIKLSDGRVGWIRSNELEVI